jgi:hypothetical protein
MNQTERKLRIAQHCRQGAPVAASSPRAQCRSQPAPSAARPHRPRTRLAHMQDGRGPQSLVTWARLPQPFVRLNTHWL